MAAVADPKSVKVNLSTGTGLDIEWKDGHRSHYSFPFLRDACPCALCDEQRSKTHQQPGEPWNLFVAVFAGLVSVRGVQGGAGQQGERLEMRRPRFLGAK
jgi:hypothetical protein